MRWRGLLVLLVLVIALIPGAALAQEEDSEGSFILGIGSDTYVRADQTVETVVVIDEDAVIDGTITDALIVVSGTATVTGTIDGDVTVVRGTLNLEDGARVANDVVLFDSDVNQVAGATVAGDVRTESLTFIGWQFTMFSILIWIGSTIAILFAGLLFAAFGGRQLTGAGNLITNQPGKTALTALIVGIGLPVAAVLAIVTLIGLPVGLGVLIFLLPALWFAGYLVAGTKLGVLMLQRSKAVQEEVEHPYLAAVVGLLFLQVIGFVPVVGGLMVGLAGFMGVGAVAYYAYKGWRGSDTVEGPTTMTTTQPAPAV